MTKSACADLKSLYNVTALKNDFVLQARGFCTDFSLPELMSSQRAIFNQCMRELGKMNILTTAEEVVKAVVT